MENNDLKIRQADVEKFMRSALLRHHLNFFKDVYNRCIRKNMSIADIVKEVKDKKSPFTVSQREFLIAFKEEFLKVCLRDIFNERQLSQIKDFDVITSEVIENETSSNE